MLAAVAALLVGCSGVESLSFPSPPATTAPPVATPPTLGGDLASVGQAPVPGTTTTTAPPIGPGSSSIVGTVLAQGAPVVGATVEADRFVGDQMTSTAVTTGADGSFLIPNVLGGRYRVRAWRPPDLDMTDPVFFFLPDGQQRGVNLQLTAYKGPEVATAINPGSLQVGELANLLVQVTDPIVGSDGVVRSQPAVGASVELVDGPSWVVYNGNPQVTGPSGRVLFQVSCDQAGQDPLSVAVGSSAPQPLRLPYCTQPSTPPSGPCPSTSTSTVPGFNQPTDTPGGSSSTNQPTASC